ncbi:MAG: hypothetical protein ABSG95_08480 [Solirubrobacteraceae bacterium]|jgi:hypothetical protein
MSADQESRAPAPGVGAADAAGAPTEEELRAAYEAELSRITSADMIAQAAVSLLNIGARRLGGPAESTAEAKDRAQPAGAGAGGAGPGSERDLEQVRDAIDAVRALLGILERRVPGELRPLRDALAQLQIAYAREAQAAGPEAQAAVPEAQAAGPEAPGEAGAGTGARPAGSSTGAPAREPSAQPGDAPAGGERPDGPGPAESSGRLWLPGR